MLIERATPNLVVIGGEEKLPEDARRSFGGLMRGALRAAGCENPF
jgi:hypothetical protein